MGVLIDWDNIDQGSEASNPTLISSEPYLAIDYLLAKPWGHLYRYELESFVYILVWAATHYNLKAKTRTERVHKSLTQWITGASSDRGKEKEFFVRIKNGSARNDWHDTVGEDFEPLADSVIEPLLDLLSGGYADKPNRKKALQVDYDYITCGGHITFKTFMERIGHFQRRVS